MSISRFLKTGLLLILMGGLFSSQAWACEVCYGAADSPMLDGMGASILFLLATTYFVIAAMGLTFFISRRRARQLQLEAAPEEGA